MSSENKTRRSWATITMLCKQTRLGCPINGKQINLSSGGRVGLAWSWWGTSVAGLQHRSLQGASPPCPPASQRFRRAAWGSSEHFPGRHARVVLSPPGRKKFPAQGSEVNALPKPEPELPATTRFITVQCFSRGIRTLQPPTFSQIHSIHIL